MERIKYATGHKTVCYMKFSSALNTFSHYRMQPSFDFVLNVP